MLALAGLDPRTWIRLQHTEHLDHLAVAADRDAVPAPPMAAPLLTPRVLAPCC